MIHYGHDRRGNPVVILRDILRGDPYNTNFVTFVEERSTRVCMVKFTVTIEDGNCHTDFENVQSKRKIGSLDLPLKGITPDDAVMAAMDVAAILAQTLEIHLAPD